MDACRLSDVPARLCVRAEASARRLTTRPPVSHVRAEGEHRRAMSPPTGLGGWLWAIHQVRTETTYELYFRRRLRFVRALTCAPAVCNIRAQLQADKRLPMGTARPTYAEARVPPRTGGTPRPRRTGVIAPPRRTRKHSASSPALPSSLVARRRQRRPTARPPHNARRGRRDDVLQRLEEARCPRPADLPLQTRLPARPLRPQPSATHMIYWRRMLQSPPAPLESQRLRGERSPSVARCRLRRGRGTPPLRRSRPLPSPSAPPPPKNSDGPANSLSAAACAAFHRFELSTLKAPIVPSSWRRAMALATQVTEASSGLLFFLRFDAMPMPPPRASVACRTTHDKPTLARRGLELREAACGLVHPWPGALLLLRLPSTTNACRPSTPPSAHLRKPGRSQEMQRSRICCAAAYGGPKSSKCRSVGQI